ncbi:MAG: hypothetical protein JW894_08260 [Bacteroidales bacterium]|nr:hypothetical protein [Bacteroidales bacterium]
MQSKLQELTTKIYQEGVEKGNAEAQQIVEGAKAEANKIIEKAKKEAGSIVENAKKAATEEKINTESEIKLSAKQAINSLKQQIVDVVNGEISAGSVKGSLEDKEFIKKILDTTLSNWARSGQSMDLAVLLPDKDEKELNAFFNNALKKYLDTGVVIQFDSGLKSGFQIGPKDGSYKVSFTEEDFTNFFKLYLRPKLVKILFSDK